MKAGLLVVDRRVTLEYAAKQDKRAHGGLDPKRNETVARRYRGIDGRVWPRREHGFTLQDGVADLSELQSVEAYRNEFPRDRLVELIAVGEPGADMSALRSFSSRGFDVGYLESEWSVFSVILNEVLFGSIEKLCAFESELNDSMLLPTESAARRLIADHVLLRDSGADVEGGAMAVIAVFAPGG